MAHDCAGLHRMSDNLSTLKRKSVMCWIAWFQRKALSKGLWLLGMRCLLRSILPAHSPGITRTKRSVGQVREYTAGVARLRANGVKPAGSVKDGIHVVHRTIMRRAEVAVANRDFTLALELIEQYNAAAWKANNLPALSHVRWRYHQFCCMSLVRHAHGIPNVLLCLVFCCSW